MSLFPAELLNEINALQGAEHSFLKQLADPAGEPIRRHFNQLVDQAPESLQKRWLDSLRSLDNRRFFQGFSEVSSAAFLQESGWRLVGLNEPGPCLQIERTGINGTPERAQLMVLAFIQATKTAVDTKAIERLVRVINNTATRSRVAILIRKWQPHEFDPLPVRRAIEMWLREIDHGRQTGRYATYENDHISLEFGLTDTKTRTTGGTVAFAIGPLHGFRTLEVVETRLIYELDAHRLKSTAKEPLIVSLATNTAWPLSPGLLRGLLYGRPSSHLVNGLPHREEFTFGPDAGPALFRDPLYNRVSATMVTEQGPKRGPCARMYLNPWAQSAFDPNCAGCASFGVERWVNADPVMRWYSPRGTASNSTSA